MSQDLEILIDARSASTNRMSGWERYTRSLVSVATEIDGIGIRATSPESLITRLWDDWVALPSAAHRAEFIHYPTFPPTPLVSSSQTIATLHDLTWWHYPETASLAGRFYYKNLARRLGSVAALVTVSNAMKSEIEQLFPHAPVSVVSPVVRLSEVRPIVKQIAGRPYIVAVGSVEPRKNLDRLARAYCESGLRSIVDLVLVGRVAWGSMPSGIISAGRVSDGELRYILEHSQGLICPSLYEGFGLPVAEAESLGVPVACSGISAFQEVARNPIAVFSPYSQKEMAEAMVALVEISDEEAISVLSDNKTPYTYERMRRSLVELYASLPLAR